ncbi:MAG: glycerol-3-phosphate dehydrogenase [Proteobacteria bacterium]|nr:glycerol-3-phosphate dehydrogenase [Pseudomonadota bacterium]
MPPVSNASPATAPPPEHYDIFIIGGGINGAGVARDAAGRGYRVALCDSGDFGSGTSSASTKLIHGGLRYLEHYKFRLVREALRERERLWQLAPHIIWPMRFVLPHHRGLRPQWLLRLGLFIYDHLGGRKLLPPASRIELGQDAAGDVLQSAFVTAFEYSDCWGEDSRLVILNLRDAWMNGASIMPRSKLVNAEFAQDTWHLTIAASNGELRYVNADQLVNAAGPWVDQVLRQALGRNDSDNIRLVGGSHIVIKRKLPDRRAYLFQADDGRVIFAIPYETDFLLIGTTDNDDVSLHQPAEITQAEVQYLCDMASQYLREAVTPEDVVWHFSGVRPLFDDGASAATEATRDYVIVQDQETQGRLINIFGGKITTYRKLAEEVLALIDKLAMRKTRKWTATAALPGGDFPANDFASLVARAVQDFPFVEKALIERLARLYGTRLWLLLASCNSAADLGRHFGAGLYQVEVDYLVAEEWAQQAQDIVFRRTKLGLRMQSEQIDALADYLRTAEVGLATTQS